MRRINSLNGKANIARGEAMESLSWEEGGGGGRKARKVAMKAQSQSQKKKSFISSLCAIE